MSHSENDNFTPIALLALVVENIDQPLVLPLTLPRMLIEKVDRNT